MAVCFHPAVAALYCRGLRLPHWALLGQPHTASACQDMARLSAMYALVGLFG